MLNASSIPADQTHRSSCSKLLPSARTNYIHYEIPHGTFDIHSSLESTIHNLDTFLINHKPLFTIHHSLPQIKRHSTTINDLLLLAHKITITWQKSSKERPKVDTMPADDNILMVDIRKSHTTKFAHTLVSIGINGFVPIVVLHLDLSCKNGLEVAFGVGLVDPRWCDVGLGRGDGECIRVSGYFLQRRYNQYFLRWVFDESVLEGRGNGGDGPT
mmetsp:Transcript_17742/g.25927  ORF Transcript_17742/g.25927 Transcript_17742/m.25927 type:complete len:215 (+) Transcript_17742:189-833(+)